MIIELVARGEPPDAALLAEMPERPETLEYIPMFRRWMDDHGVPNETVSYTPKRFKHWPPYYNLLENLLTNGTLPSISFGRHSCSQKWKIAPQDRWTENWPPAQAAWARGDPVVKLIGYDCSPADNRRYAHREGHVDPRFLFRYPLREWGWTREDCIARIQAAGLPVPVKSSCFFLCLQMVSRLTVSLCFEAYKIIRRLRRFPTIEALGAVAKRYCTLQLPRAQPPKADRLARITNLPPAFLAALSAVAGFRRPFLPAPPPA
ncbi:hypothetical protein PX554_25515 [Sphingomonas sp. H39-1-10]|nr:hypothetical protein [Sphingomonas pollutisoli]MDF0491480.1 hypothetical protein [Sphingomonas pollutisoli]